MSKSYLNISVQLLQTECESGVLYYQDSWWGSKRRGDDCGHSQFYCEARGHIQRKCRKWWISQVTYHFYR